MVRNRDDDCTPFLQPCRRPIRQPKRPYDTPSSTLSIQEVVKVAPILRTHMSFSVSRLRAQRFVPDDLKLRTARFEHAHRRFAELSHIDHGIKLCPLFVDLGDRARSGVQNSSKTVCTDIRWESLSHQHLQIRQLSDEVAVKCL